jgi:hypothetical protein
MANLPVEAKGINQATQPPTMLLAHREYLRCTSRQRPRENFIRVRDRQDHSDRAATKRLRFWFIRLSVTYPKLCAVHGKPRNHSCLWIF